MKSVQIPYELFLDLVRYHLAEDDEVGAGIKKSLEKKLESMIDRQLYSEYKTAPTEAQREKARQEYLDRKGVLPGFSWSTSPWEK